MKSLKNNLSFTRRRGVLRAGTSYFSLRDASKAERYKKGIEAASLFELPDSLYIRAEEDTIKEYTSPFVNYVVTHKKGLIAACLVLLFAAAGIWGYFYINNLFHSSSTFIQDEEQAGNVTITERLTTSDELAEKVVYFLVVGVDDSSLLTDCIWLTCYDIEASKINVMQIPRDTYVGDESITGKINNVYGNPKKVKYCETCGYSPVGDEISDGEHTLCGTKLTTVRESNISALIRVVNENLGMPIDHFVIFNFAGFAKIVNTMGGVDITLERGIHDGAITLSAGTHHLGGWQAVDYMRHRKSYAQGDIARVSAQRIMINALMEQAFRMELTDMLALVTQCSDCFQTDLSMQDILKYATLARSVSTDSLDMFTMPGVDHWVRPNPSYYICYEEDAAQLINEKLLPYGLPDGSYATGETINFPKIVDALSPSSNTTSGTESTTGATAASTAPTDAPPVTVNSENTTASTTTTTTTSTSASTTTSTTASTTTTTTTSTTTTTTAPTAAPTPPPTTETFVTFVEESIGLSRQTQYTPLSDPRYNPAA